MNDFSACRCVSIFVMRTSAEVFASCSLVRDATRCATASFSCLMRSAFRAARMSDFSKLCCRIVSSRSTRSTITPSRGASHAAVDVGFGCRVAVGSGSGVSFGSGPAVVGFGRGVVAGAGPAVVGPGRGFVAGSGPQDGTRMLSNPRLTSVFCNPMLPAPSSFTRFGSGPGSVVVECGAFLSSLQEG